MARLRRFVLLDQRQHVIQHGNNREVIFRVAADIRRQLS